MNDSQKEFIAKAAAEAERCQHPFPLMAACEAALESNYGKSQLAIDGNNLFGMKEHRHNVYGVLKLPTREFEGGKWIQTEADWVKYPDLSACFADRLATLRRLSSVYSRYAAALAAKDPKAFVTEVSKTWSTDPERAAKVISIYDAYQAETLAQGASV